MPSSLVSAKIRGIRSYSPRPDREQVIEFMPLTLIVGSNGTGKTTIIEALKFIISGNEPPNSDSRRNFIHDPKDEKSLICSSPEYACIELTFKDPSGQLCIAKRQIARSTGKTATPSCTSSYKIGTKPWTSVHRQDDWGKILPRLFGLPNQAILNSIILCHQEENLWCMGESAKVKEVFDKVFGCEEYKKEMKHIDDEIRNTKKDQLLLEKDLDRFRERVLRKDEMAKQIADMEVELRRISTEVIGVNADVENLVARKKKLSDIIENADRKTRELDKLKQRIRELTERDAIYRKSLQALAVKRPAPAPAPVNRLQQQPARKRPAPDPTASDLELVVQDFAEMLKIIDVMPGSDDMTKLKACVDRAFERIQVMKKRFDGPSSEPPREPTPPPRVEEEDNSAELQLKAYRQEVEDNISRNLADLDGIRESIARVEKESSGDTKVQGAMEDLRAIERDLVTARDNRSVMQGTKQQMERELTRLKAELRGYQRVNILYSESLGKFVCNKIVLEDLEKLKVCFMESLTKFHDQMFIKINDLLRRRWKIIYQGKDIESIELVDEETTRGKDKKSYNYYMAMRKDGKRMKMKEKSSAGQRALAAIILRMTLAELFVSDFAFIALDEPTANLDLANVQSLAKSIGAYVRRRTKLGINIQWIIITHDEQFLRALDEECSPYFYRIKMDPSDKCSNIVKISCHESGYMPNKENGTD